MQLIRVFFVAFIHFANICMSVVSLQPGNEMQTCAWGRELMYTQTEWYDSSHCSATNSHESLIFYYILIYFVSVWMCAYICMHVPMSFWVWRSAYNLALSTTVFLEIELRFMPITQGAQSCPQFSVLQKSSFLSLSYYPQIFIYFSFFFFTLQNSFSGMFWRFRLAYEIMYFWVSHDISLLKTHGIFILNVSMSIFSNIYQFFVVRIFLCSIHYLQPPYWVTPFNIFISWELYKMYFDHIQPCPQILSNPFPCLYTPKFLFSFSPSSSPSPLPPFFSPSLIPSLHPLSFWPWSPLYFLMCSHTLKHVWPPKVTPLKKTDSSSPSTHQLPIAPQQEVELCVHLPCLCWNLRYLSLHRFGTWCHNCCGFICSLILWYPGIIVFFCSPWPHTPLSSLLW